nr:KACytosolic 10-formyltetrahydrofolate dehydrogenase [Biomphalaria glabrata]
MHTLGLASKKVAEESMEKAAREVKEKVGISNEEGITDCDVSVDGTWQRRGHSSHHSGVAAKSIETAILNIIKPIFDELADKSLLSKCLQGKTQNAKEALNKLIWDRCSKGYYVEKNVIEEAVYSAIAYFNDGAESVLELHTKLGLGNGYFSRQMCTKKDLKQKVKKGPMQL